MNTAIFHNLNTHHTYHNSPLWWAHIHPPFQRYSRDKVHHHQDTFKHRRWNVYLCSYCTSFEHTLAVFVCFSVSCSVMWLLLLFVYLLLLLLFSLFFFFFFFFFFFSFFSLPSFLPPPPPPPFFIYWEEGGGAVSQSVVTTAVSTDSSANVRTPRIFRISTLTRVLSDRSTRTIPRACVLTLPASSVTSSVSWAVWGWRVLFQLKTRSR